MNEKTELIHQQSARLGKTLGFETSREVSDSMLRLRLENAYHPRIDLMWSLPLDEPKRNAIAWALEQDTAGITHLPVVGIEVEGTTPSTKIMASDVANLAALGVPLGLLIVSEGGEANIYRRAARAIRTVRRAFGDITVVPIEAGWLDDLLGRNDWPKGLSALPVPKLKAPAGGESREWSAKTRSLLRKKGEEAGFVVAEPYRPQILEASYDWAQGHRTQGLRHVIKPVGGTPVPMQKPGDYFTACEIDLAWLMPLPASLSTFLRRIDELDPCHREHGLYFSELWSACAVVAFELETTSGKHAGGGLLNLAAYGILGISVAETAIIKDEIWSTLLRYRPTLGLRNVFVRALP